MSYATLQVRWHATTCFARIHRPDAGNAINATLLAELTELLVRADAGDTTVVVLEGLPEVFCFGADFGVIRDAARAGEPAAADPALLYDVFHRLAFGRYMTVAHVRGKANAGGVGLAAACDVVLADASAAFSLSEMVFGLIPAVVLPFLIRRIGFSRASYLAATTQTIDVVRAHAWGLVDAHEPASDLLVRRHLVRLGRLSKKAIERYKRYLGELAAIPEAVRGAALATNREVFGDPDNIRAIARYAEHGLFPWEDAP